MILPIVKYGDPVLRKKGTRIEKVDATIRDLAENMVHTMHAANGVGLAAHQVGVAVQLAVVDVANIEDRPSTMMMGHELVALEPFMPLVLINPELTLGKEREIGSEGCLSFPEITADIVRATEVQAKAQQLDGTTVEFIATGLLARALQHEVDHLHGVLFIDRMNAAMKASLAGKLKRLQKEARG